MSPQIHSGSSVALLRRAKPRGCQTAGAEVPAVGTLNASAASTSGLSMEGRGTADNAVSGAVDQSVSTVAEPDGYVAAAGAIPPPAGAPKPPPATTAGPIVEGRAAADAATSLRGDQSLAAVARPAGHVAAVVMEPQTAGTRTLPPTVRAGSSMEGRSVAASAISSRDGRLAAVVAHVTGHVAAASAVVPIGGADKAPSVTT